MKLRADLKVEKSKNDDMRLKPKYDLLVKKGEAQQKEIQELGEELDSSNKKTIEFDAMKEKNTEQMQQMASMKQQLDEALQ